MNVVAYSWNESSLIIYFSISRGKDGDNKQGEDEHEDAVPGGCEVEPVRTPCTGY